MQKLLVITQNYVENIIQTELYAILNINRCDEQLVLTQFLQLDEFRQGLRLEFLEHQRLVGTIYAALVACSVQAE